MDKPPIGAASHWFVNYKRMDELADAIKNCIQYAHDNQYRDMSDTYRVIAVWAEELRTLAELEAKLIKTEMIK